MIRVNGKRVGVSMISLLVLVVVLLVVVLVDCLGVELPLASVPRFRTS